LLDYQLKINDTINVQNEDLEQKLKEADSMLNEQKEQYQE